MIRFMIARSLSVVLLADVLDAPNDEAVAATVRAKVSAICKKFPVYGA